MSGCPYVHDLPNENAVVGKTYLVRTIRPRGWMDIPVMGDAHEDREILGVHEYHFHFDLRFVSDEMAVTLWQRMSRHPPQLGKGRFRLELLMISSFTVPRAHRKAGAYKPWTCVRTMPRYPGWMYVNYTERIEAYVRRFNLKLRVDRRGCLRCPHRGMPLAGLSATEHDIITCPAHGASWKLATGELVQGYTCSGQRGSLGEQTKA